MRFRQQVLTSGLGFRRLAVALGLGGLAALGGCKNFLDQGDVSTRDINAPSRLVVPILTSIDPLDPSNTEFTSAEPVRQGDLKVVSSDYIIGRNDLILVSVFDLIPNQETVNQARVSETGLLSLKHLEEPVRAAGLTEQQLQRAIAQKYKDAQLLERATVSVSVLDARQRTFSALGAVTRPGLYPITEGDFRLTDALVQIVIQYPGIEYLYVVRKISSETPSSAQPATAPATNEPKKPDVDLLAPHGEAPVARPMLAMLQPSDMPATRPAEPIAEDRYIFLDGKPVLVPATRAADAAPNVEPSAAIPAVNAGATAEAPAKQPAFQFGETLVTDGTQRIIRVPLRDLRNGHLEYNIVVRAGDTIIVPEPPVGLYYVGGHVGSPGVYSFGGQKITLTQAVIAARMLGPLAVPEKTDLVRKIGDNQMFVRVDLRAIFEGKQPNIYLKQDDEIRVGTDWYPPFLAAIRGAFRVTYGFGFLYDRNFAPEQKQND